MHIFYIYINFYFFFLLNNQVLKLFDSLPVCSMISKIIHWIKSNYYFCLNISLQNKFIKQIIRIFNHCVKIIFTQLSL